MGFDLVIRNGTVVDGTGRPRYRADIGIRGDRIHAIGRIRERGKQEIDAEGQVVSPGFIEVHSHMDAQVFWDSLGTCSAWHGNTTTVMGNCGFTLAPCREREMDLCLRSLERAEDISRDAMLAGIKWKWETFPEYLDVVDALPKGINYAGYIGHSALRSYVMGQRAFEKAATDDDLAAMAREVNNAIKAGAIGFSTSRTESHTTSDDKPVASRQATWDELRVLVGEMTKLGAGLFEIATNNWGTLDDRKTAQSSLRDLVVESGRPMSCTVFNLPGQDDTWREMLALAEDISAHGGRMFAQVHTRQFQEVNGFRTRLPFDQLPTWRTIRSRPLEEQRMALLDPELRARLVREALEGPYKNVTSGMNSRPPNWESMSVLESPVGPNRTLAQIARERGVTPADAFVELAIASNLEQLFVQPAANLDMSEVLTMLRNPHTIIGSADSGAHVSQIIDSSIPTFFMAHWVRNEKAFTLEEGVRKLTFDPAFAWGFSDRGLIAPGMVADLVIFDPDRIGPDLPKAAYDLPSGAVRLKQKAVGISATIVAGTVLLRDGEHTGAHPGRLLRGPLAT
jgi:N-acyl-D-amino-acid deacylase